MASRAQWSIDFLTALGNQAPSADTIKLVSAWTASEGTKAKYNPLATTLNYGTNTNFNTVGVKNYSTRQEGIEASVMTLRGDHSGYAELLAGLQSDDPERSLKSGGLDTWGSGSAAVMIIYRTTDVRGQMLASESDNEQLLPQPSLVDTLTKPSPTLQTVDAPKETASAPQDLFTADMLSGFFKQVLGWGIVAVGVLILVKAAMGTDTAKHAIKTAETIAVVAA